MLKENDYVFHRANVAADLALTALAVVGAHHLRNAVLAPYFLPDVFRQPSRFADYAWLAAAMPVAMVLAMAANGCYRSQRTRGFGSTLRAVAASAAVAATMTMGLSFLVADRPAGADDTAGFGENVSRGVVLTAPALAFALIALKTLVIRRALMALRRRGYNYRTLLLVGSGANLRRFIALVESHPLWGFRLTGIIDDSGREAKAVERIPVVGGLTDLLPHLERSPVDEVVFIPARRSLDDLAPYFEGCEEMGVRTRLGLNFFRHTIARPVLDEFEGMPMVTYSPVREMNGALLFKSAFDRVAAAAALVVLAPVFTAVAVAVKLSSGPGAKAGGPVFFGQERVGLQGRPFTLWKFRSMAVGADKLVAQLQSRNEMSGPVFKIRDDPRVTPVGRWLRKTSLDELPQLWNVLRGDMSLVGPRPPLPREVEKYDRWQRRRLSMKPGITCLWQVNGRNYLSFETWMKLDLEYIDNWSLALDARILVKTVYVVATGHGAM